MRLVGPPLLEAFPNRILNIHPSLLPAFPGLDAQRQALEHGVRVSRRDRASGDRRARRRTDRRCRRRCRCSTTTPSRRCRRGSWSRSIGSIRRRFGVVLGLADGRRCEGGASSYQSSDDAFNLVSLESSAKPSCSGRNLIQMLHLATESRSLSVGERQDRDFRRAVDAHRHVDRADAAADEDRRACRGADARDHRKLLRGDGADAPAARPGRRACGPTAPAELSAPPPPLSRRGSCASRIDGAAWRRARAARCRPARFVQKRMPARSTVSSRIVSACARPSAPRRRARRAPPACRGRRRGCRGWRRRRAAPTAAPAPRPPALTYSPIAPGDVVAAEHDQIRAFAPSTPRPRCADVLVPRPSGCDGRRSSGRCAVRRAPAAGRRPATSARVTSSAWRS